MCPSVASVRRGRRGERGGLFLCPGRLCGGRSRLRTALAGDGSSFANFLLFDVQSIYAWILPGRGGRARILLECHRSLDDALVNRRGSLCTRRCAYEQQRGQKAAVEVHLLDSRGVHWKECCGDQAAGVLRGLTFELTPTAEAGGVSPVRDDATPAADRAYDACRSGSGVERGVRPQHGAPMCGRTRQAKG
jgi:hypothetical protein